MPLNKHWFPPPPPRPVVYKELKKATCFFRTSRTSGISPFFYIPVLKYHLLVVTVDRSAAENFGRSRSCVRSCVRSTAAAGILNSTQSKEKLEK